MRVAVALGLGLLVTVGCGKVEKSDEFASCAPGTRCVAMMQGKVAGKTWKYRYGTAVQPVGAQSVWAVALHEKEPAGDACKGKSTFSSVDPSYTVRFFVYDLKAGALDFKLGSGKGSVSLSKTMKTGTGIASEAVAAFGEGTITAVTEETFAGQLSVKADDNNFVSGPFVVKLCKN